MSTHPPPLTACRDALDEEIPRSARPLAKAATATGWKMRTTYAHGTGIGAQGQPTQLIESVLVRLRREPLAAVAAWHNNKFISAWVWSRYSSPRPIGFRDLGRFVRGTS